MIDLNKYYVAKTYDGVSGSYAGRPGFVPQATTGDAKKFLRGDGVWSDPTISTIQFINGSGNVVLDVENYSTFCINTAVSNNFVYSGFNVGQSINVYISGSNTGYLPHAFPENTVFSELGDGNIIYSFSGYATRILLQNVGGSVINFSSIVPVTVSAPYYYDNELNLTVGVGTILLDEFLNNI
jgi:hypothetical protein